MDKIRKIIESDYHEVEQVRRLTTMRGGRQTTKTFYLNFSRAIDELHACASPFVVTRDQFINQVKYLQEKVNKDVYSIILDYCKNKLGLNIN